MSLCLNQFQSRFLAPKGSNTYIYLNSDIASTTVPINLEAAQLSSDFLVLKEYMETQIFSSIHPFVTYRIFFFLNTKTSIRDTREIPPLLTTKLYLILF